MVKINVDKEAVIEAFMNMVSPEEASLILAKIIIRKNSKKTLLSASKEKPITPELRKLVLTSYGSNFKNISEISMKTGLSSTKIETILREGGYVLYKDHLAPTKEFKKRDSNRKAAIIEALDSGMAVSEITKKFNVKPSYIYYITWQQKKQKQ